MKVATMSRGSCAIAAAMALFACARCTTKDAAPPDTEEAAEQTAQTGEPTPPTTAAGGDKDAAAAADEAIPAKAAAPVELTSLPVWSSPVGLAPSTVVGFELHAADADWEWLRIMIADPAKPHIAKSGKGQRATGRMAAGKRAELFAALDTAGFERMPATALRGKAPKVTFRAARTDAAELVWVLTDHLALNVAVAPDPAAHEVTLLVPGHPADAVLSAVTSAASWNSFRTGGITFIGPATMTSPDQRLRRTPGPTLDLVVRGARASDAIALLERVAPVPFSVPCDGGPELRLSLRKVKLSAALGAIAVASGLELTPRAGDNPCSTAALDSIDAAALPSARLLGVVTTKDAAAAVVHNADEQPTTLVRGDRVGGLRVGDIKDGQVFLGGDGGRTWSLLPVEGYGADGPVPAWASASLAGARLSATFVTTDGAFALVELPTGAHFIIAASADGDRTATIEPGHVVLARDGRVVADLRLAKRAAPP